MADRFKRSKVLAQLGLPCYLCNSSGERLLLLSVTTEPTRTDEKHFLAAGYLPQKPYANSILSPTPVLPITFIFNPQLILNIFTSNITLRQVANRTISSFSSLILVLSLALTKKAFGKRFLRSAISSGVIKSILFITSNFGNSASFKS